MRMIVVAVLQATGWTALAPAHPGAAAPMAAAPLAAGEVLLEVEDTGSVTTRADVARISIPVTAVARTAPEARRSAAAAAAKIVEALRTAGVAPGDVTTQEGVRAIGFVGNAAVDELIDAQAAAQPVSARDTIEVRLRDPAGFERVRAAAEAAGAANVPQPAYSLSDEARPREAAKAEALRRARASAEAYARALGLRVARIARVSERSSGADFGVKQAAAMMRAMNGAPTGSPGQVETEVTLDVDFALAPRP